jgi:hypothetical protein
MGDTNTPEELWKKLLEELNKSLGNNKRDWAKNVKAAAENLKKNLDTAADKEVFLVVKVEKEKLTAGGVENVEQKLAIKKTELEAAKKKLNVEAAKVEEVKAAGDSKPDTSYEFSSFLSSIGESVVASQENLDKESINYLTRLQEDEIYGSIIPPTVFRIPKLKASLKLGIERSESKKLNVLIFGKEEKSNKINQQSVELEIMAVPASAELLQNLRGKIPQIQFVLSPREREFLFENIKTVVASESDSIKKSNYGDMLESENSNRVIFWRTTKSKSTEPDVFLVLYAGKVKTDKSHHVCLWQLKLTKKPSLQAIIRYALAPNSNTKQDQGLLHNFVSILTDRQEALLNS